MCRERIRRPKWLIGLLTVTSLSTSLIGCGSGDSSTIATRTVTETVTVSVGAPVLGGSPPVAANRSEYKLGDAFDFASAKITVTKVDTTDTVALEDGGAMTADPGEQLVIVHGHYVNNTGQPQGYCGSTLGDTMYVKVFDTNGSQTSDVTNGDTYKIPGSGNACGDELLPGQEDDFVIAGRSVKGAVPGYMELEDKRDGTVVRVALT